MVNPNYYGYDATFLLHNNKGRKHIWQVEFCQKGKGDESSQCVQMLRATLKRATNDVLQLNYYSIAKITSFSVLPYTYKDDIKKSSTKSGIITSV